MGKYTYTASLVDESINILRRADQELSGTNAAVINAVNTILNARGADRLAFDFSDILTLTDIARDDIAAVTKEILSKQAEIEEYENAPWWKKLFASLGMAILKYLEGHAQAIEYVFDFAVSLAGFIGGLFNSNFKNACKEFAEKELVDSWFTKQFVDENGMFKNINAYSTFAHNSTAANIIEFGGSLINVLGITGPSTGLIISANSLYKSFENLMDESDTKAIITSEPIISPDVKEIFDIKKLEEPLQDDKPPIVDELISDPAPTPNGEEQFEGEGVCEPGQVLYGVLPPKEPIQPGQGEGVCKPGQVLYGVLPPKDPVQPEEPIVVSKPVQVLYGPPPQPPVKPGEPIVVSKPVQVLYGPPPQPPIQPGEEIKVCGPGQVLYGVLPPKDPIQPIEHIVDAPGQVLYGPPTTIPNHVEQNIIENRIIGENQPTYIANAPVTEEIAKKAAGSFGDLMSGAGSTPISSKPLSSTGNHGEGQVSAPLASGVIAAGVAGWGTKTYIDKRGTTDKKEDKEIDAEKWDEDVESLNIDYTDGRIEGVDGDYLSPDDELAFMD